MNSPAFDYDATDIEELFGEPFGKIAEDSAWRTYLLLLQYHGEGLDNRAVHRLGVALRNTEEEWRRK